MQREARHAHEHGWLQGLDQPQLHLGRAGIAGAGPDHTNLEQLGTARPHLAGGMNADRKRDVTEIAGGNSNARKRASPGEQAVADILVRARVEHRRAGGTAGTPVLGNLVRGCTAELAQELVMVELAQALLVEDRDLAPLRWVIEAIGIEALKLAAIPGDLLHPRKGDVLALALDGADHYSRDLGSGSGSVMRVPRRPGPNCDTARYRRLALCLRRRPSRWPCGAHLNVSATRQRSAACPLAPRLQPRGCFNPLQSAQSNSRTHLGAGHGPVASDRRGLSPKRSSTGMNDLPAAGPAPSWSKPPECATFRAAHCFASDMTDLPGLQRLVEVVRRGKPWPHQAVHPDHRFSGGVAPTRAAEILRTLFGRSPGGPARVSTMRRCCSMRSAALLPVFCIEGDRCCAGAA